MVWDDVESFWRLGVGHDVCCINSIGMNYPCDFDHWFSYHGVQMVDMAGDRCSAILHSISPCVHPRINYSWKLYEKGGSSAFMAARCAVMYWGYERVVFAGCGLTNDGYWNGNSGNDSYRYTETFLGTWKRFHPELKDIFRSMSGNTMKLYGYPSAGWLKNGAD